MGLDMYLTAEASLYNHQDPDGKRRSHLKRAFPEFKGFNGFVVVEAEVAYWRKANSIHKWFVDNVQNGVDDCDKYHVTRDHLLALLKACRAVLRNRTKAPELLPCQGGFFFGSTNYDEGYWQDIVDTRNQLKKVLNLKDARITYQASW